MDIGMTDSIVAIIALDKKYVDSATVPVFIAESEESQERIALLVAKVTKGMVHDLRNGIYVVVRH